VPWTDIQIEEAEAVTGPWTLIDTLPIPIVDADPSNPASQDFTTVNDTAADLWYRVKFTDGDGNESLPTTPLQNTSDIPTVYGSESELALILHVNEASNTTALTRVLTSASAEIDAELGRESAFTDVPALVTEVALERAVEHWQQMKSPFGVIGLGAEAGPTLTATDSWNRHANKLAPYKQSWGVA